MAPGNPMYWLEDDRCTLWIPLHGPSLRSNEGTSKSLPDDAVLARRINNTLSQLSGIRAGAIRAAAMQDEQGESLQGSLTFHYSLGNNTNNRGTIDRDRLLRCLEEWGFLKAPLRTIASQVSIPAADIRLATNPRR